MIFTASPDPSPFPDVVADIIAGLPTFRASPSRLDREGSTPAADIEDACYKVGWHRLDAGHCVETPAPLLLVDSHSLLAGNRNWRDLYGQKGTAHGLWHSHIRYQFLDDDMPNLGTYGEAASAGTPGRSAGVLPVDFEQAGEQRSGRTAFLLPPRDGLREDDPVRTALCCLLLRWMIRSPEVDDGEASQQAARLLREAVVLRVG